MAKKPNYAFERNAKAKAKAEKREAKRLAKIAAKADGTGIVAELDEDAAPGADTSARDEA